MNTLSTLLLTSITVFTFCVTGRAELITADLAVCAGEKPMPAGFPIELVAPMQSRLGSDLGLRHQMLNPARARLMTASGSAVEAQFIGTRLEAGDALGAQITFKLAAPIPAGQKAVYRLVFETIGHELIGNSPDLRNEPLQPTEDIGDFALTQRGKAWDFNENDPPVITGAWHAVTREGLDGCLVATADGTYSSPVIGSIEGPIDGAAYPRLVVRARREGPNPSALLVNTKNYPTDSRNSLDLKEQFDIYTIDLTGRPEWGDTVEKITLRWGHGRPQPTTQDKIIIDWIRLLNTRSFVHLGRLEKADDDVTLDAAASPAVRMAASAAKPRQRRTTMQAFFEPAADRASEWPVDRIYPQGRLLGFSLYSVGGGAHPLTADGQQLPAAIAKDQQVVAATARIKADGFTMMGPQYELNHRVIQDAESAGIKCIYTVGDDERGRAWTSFIHDRNVDFDPAEVEARAKAAVEAVAHHETIAWWNITPEEMRYWRASEMQYMAAMYRGVKAGDPLKRPVMMYEPNNRGAEALSRTLPFQDITGKGIYANYANQRDTRGPWIRWSIEQELEAMKIANRPDTLPLAIPEMFQQPPAELAHLAGDWARHDTYLALICGARGVVVFSMRIRPGFDAHEAYYQGFASVARELNGPLNLGQIFLFGEPRSDFDIRVIEGPETLTLEDNFGAKLGGPVAYPTVSWFDAQYGADRYLFAVNSASVPVKTLIDGLPPGEVRAADALNPQGEAVVITTGRFQTTFTPLQVRAWRFSAAR